MPRLGGHGAPLGPGVSERLLTVAQAAERLAISPSSVKRLIAAGRLRAVHPTPGRTAVDEREVDAYIVALRKAAA